MQIHYDPRRSGAPIASQGRKRLPYYDADKEAPRITFSDPGVRVYCPIVRCWVLPPREPDLPAQRDPGAIVRPSDDGSGIWWEICEWDHRSRRYGQVMWRVEAATLDRAIAQKVKLCLARGFRPGWGRVRAAQED